MEFLDFADAKHSYCMTGIELPEINSALRNQ